MRPSATVVLVRAGPRGPEVYLVHRASGATFGSSYVFPGGVLEAADREATGRSDLENAEANRRLGLEAGGLEYYSAAIRELFEETGVLLARCRGGGPLPAPAALAAARARLNEGALDWSDFLEENGLVLACESLQYFAWWITPRVRPKRFSTRFFAAPLPEGQIASHDGRELTDGRWMTAPEALEAARRGDIVLPPPTAATLRDLAPLGDVAALFAWARRRAREGVPRILPVIVRQGGRDRVLVPGDPGYPADAGGEGDA